MTTRSPLPCYIRYFTTEPNCESMSELVVSVVREVRRQQTYRQSCIAKKNKNASHTIFKCDGDYLCEYLTYFRVTVSTVKEQGL